MKLRAKKNQVIVEPLDELKSGILHLPETRIVRCGSFCRCTVVSSGIPDAPVGSVVHCKADLGYRVPLDDRNLRIYLAEDVWLVEDFPPQSTGKNGDNVTSYKNKERDSIVVED